MKKRTIRHEPPLTGAFLRPVGRWYRYCYRVLGVLPEDKDGPEVIVAERWGVDECGAPLRDEHDAKHWLTGLRQVLPGVWRNMSETTPMGPVYYRVTGTGPAGQKELFA